MSQENEAAADYIITSPLQPWPGEVHLPPPEMFNGAHWATWMKASTLPLRRHYAMIHQFCYAGLDFVAEHGGWQMEIPLAEVQAWETDLQAERTQLVSWLGRAWMRYMDAVLNPKG
jgi:hypothetical protein